MQAATPFSNNLAGIIPLEDLGKLQSRYQAMKLGVRATAVLFDAEPALQAAERILKKLANEKQTARSISRLASDSPLIARMRTCEARGVFMDSKGDFIQATLNKMAAWRKTMQRVSVGEGVATSSSGKEYIPSSDPIAMAVFGISHFGQYLSIAQLILSDVAKADRDNLEWANSVAEMRRCATVITDYEFAAGFTALVH